MNVMRSSLFLLSDGRLRDPRDSKRDEGIQDRDLAVTSEVGVVKRQELGQSALDHQRHDPGIVAERPDTPYFTTSSFHRARTEVVSGSTPNCVATASNCSIACTG